MHALILRCVDHGGSQKLCQAPDFLCDCADGAVEEIGRIADSPVGAEKPKPLRLDIESENYGFRLLGIMLIRMRFPSIDQDCAFIREPCNPVSDLKLRVRPLHLQKNVAVRMRVAHQWAIHIQKRDTPKAPPGYAQCMRHRTKLPWCDRKHNTARAGPLWHAAVRRSHSSDQRYGRQDANQGVEFMTEKERGERAGPDACFDNLCMKEGTTADTRTSPRSRKKAYFR